jgi:hypothetical protein
MQHSDGLCFRHRHINAQPPAEVGWGHPVEIAFFQNWLANSSQTGQSRGLGSWVIVPNRVQV